MSVQLSLAWFAWKNLGRRRLRTLLTLCGIGMAIGAFVALVGFSSSFEREWLSVYESSGIDIAVVEKTFVNTSVDESATAKLLALPAVASTSPMIVNMMDLTPEINSIVYGWKADSFEFDHITLKSGRRFQDGKAEVMLGDLLADNLKKNAGDRLEIQGSPFLVTGIFHAPSPLEAGAAIMPLGELQRVASLDGKVSTIHVRLRPAPAGQSQSAYMKQVESQIESTIPGVRAVPAAERASNNQLVVMAHAISWGTSLIAIVIGVLGIANTMAMSVFERTREIGILRALGWKRWRILLLIQTEAVTLGFVGGVLGMAAGWGVLRILSVLPQTASIVSTRFSPLLLIEAFGVAILAGLIAGAIPAWRGSGLSPVEALRHD